MSGPPFDTIDSANTSAEQDARFRLLLAIAMRRRYPALALRQLIGYQGVSISSRPVGISKLGRPLELVRMDP